jgi:hypothetical protein
MPWLKYSLWVLIASLLCLTVSLMLQILQSEPPRRVVETTKESVVTAPGVTNTCLESLPSIPYSGQCGTFDKKRLTEIMQNPKGVCLFDVDGTLSVTPVFDRNKAVMKCLQNNFAVGVVTAGGYRNAHFFCEKLGLNSELPCLCDFFSVNKGVTFFQNQPLISGEYCYSSCQGDCVNECLSIKSEIEQNSEYHVDKHTIAKTCALNQVHKMYSNLDKKCISLIDNEHGWTCYSKEGQGCNGFGGQWCPYGVTEVDVSNLISHCTS